MIVGEHMKKIVVILIIALAVVGSVKGNVMELEVNGHNYTSFKIFMTKSIKYSNEEKVKLKQSIKYDLDDMKEMIETSKLERRIFVDTGNAYNLEENNSELIIEFSNIPVFRTKNEFFSILPGIEVIDSNSFYMYEYHSVTSSHTAIYRLEYKTDSLLLKYFIDKKNSN